MQDDIKDKTMVIIDTDIGDDIDDAYAVYMTICSDVEIKAITTVYRNALQRAKIAKKLLDVTKSDIPVYVGKDKPKKQEVFIAKFESVGKGGKPNIPHFNDKTMDYEISRKGAVEEIAKLLDEYPNRITLCGIGPLTNFAEIIEKYPSSFKKVKEVLLMGGELSGSFAEWNVKCDPEAFDSVLRSGVPIKMVTLEYTKLCQFNDDDLKRLSEKEDSVNKLLYSMLLKWTTDSKRSHPPTMYDGLALSVLTENFVEFEERKLKVCLDGEDRGKLIYDKNADSVKVSVNADVDGFMNYLRNILKI